MKGVFVTGTDTDVGKTVVSSWLVRGWEADYWKPVQTGTIGGRDCDTVRRLAGLSDDRIHPSAWDLKAPLSPHTAARVEDKTLSIGDFTLPATSRPLVVEGAGGVLVPLNWHDLMIDLMRRLRLPVLVAARSGLGTINHTLLTLEALRRRGLEVLGVVMVGPPDALNRESIEHFGRVPVIAQIPPLEPLSAETLARLPPPPPLP